MLFEIFYVVVLLFVILIVLLYLWLSWKWSYWPKKGVYQMKTTFPIGTFPGIFSKKIHLNYQISEEVKELENLPFYGHYILQTPILMVKDVDLVKNILVKDFDYFIDRMDYSWLKSFIESDKRSDKIWSKTLLNLCGDEWKNMRATFSPIFTSGKMKAMLIFMQETSNQLLNAININAKNTESFELKDLFGKYSMDIIASCAFGVDAESFKNKKSKFVEYGSQMFEVTFSDGLKFILGLIPGGNHILRALDIAISKNTEIEFFYQVITSSLNQRRDHINIRRNDLIDLMLDAIKGDIDAETNEDEEQFEKVCIPYNCPYICIYKTHFKVFMLRPYHKS